MILPKRISIFLLCAWIVASTAFAGANDPVPLASSFGVFEATLRSAVNYRNPLVEAGLTAQFVSPRGSTNRVNGFWDGGTTWRVRFSPDSPGKWTWRTTCTDATNAGLDNVTGEFLCTSTAGKSRFDLHGPVRVAADGRHLEHSDKTPFFWLGDTAWEGAVRSRPSDWEYYAQTRSGQKFTVSQWAATPGEDFRKRTAFTSDGELKVDPEFYRGMDEKIVALNRAGMLAAIVPLWEMVSPGGKTGEILPEEQAIPLLRYMVARWGARHVVWILTCEGSAVGGNVARWKRIGQAVFGGVAHRPVIVYPGATYWALDELRDERWVGICGYQSGRPVNDDTLLWSLSGPVSQDWKKEPARPFINLSLPFENDPDADKRVGPDAVRRAAYWSLLNAPAAGVSYGGQGVWNWVAEGNGDATRANGDSLPEWQKALYMPAARQMTVLADTIGAMNFWQLRPAPDVLAAQPGRGAPARHIAAARTEAGDTIVVYVPEERSVRLLAFALPNAPVESWINPRTGERTPARGVQDENGVREYATPESGDWLLWIQEGQR